VRLLSLIEFVVRRTLKQQGTTLVGLHKENPRKATATPTIGLTRRRFCAIIPQYIAYFM